MGRRVAIVHDWTTGYDGSERVLEQIVRSFPNADLYFVAEFVPRDQRRFLQDWRYSTSLIQRLPFARKLFRLYLPLMPLAVESLNLGSYDLVISSSHAVAKGVITGPDQCHVCYCHTPIRYAWDLEHQYMEHSKIGRCAETLSRAVMHYLRMWDTRTANGVDAFACNSDFIRRRIWKAYRRSAQVIHPPVNVEQFEPETKRENYYVTLGRLVPYKRVDVAVEAFRDLPDRRLVVIGCGPLLRTLRRSAPPNVTFLGHQPLSEVKYHLEHARAFVFASQEDFGIVAVEAQAAGTPVICFRGGGAGEAILPGRTGLLFDTQHKDSLAVAIRKFETGEPMWPASEIHAHSEQFGPERFRREFESFVEAAWERFCRESSHGEETAGEVLRSFHKN